MKIGKILNVINVILKEEKFDDFLQNKEFSFKNIIPISSDSEKEFFQKWKQPSDFYQEKIFFDKNEIIIVGRTAIEPCLKVLKELSTFDNIKEIVLQYTDVTQNGRSGVVVFFNGGVVINDYYEVNTEENKRFSNNLINLFMSDYKEEEVKNKFKENIFI